MEIQYQMSFVRVRLELDEEGRENTDTLEDSQSGLVDRRRQVELIAHRVRRREARVSAGRGYVDADVKVTFLSNTRQGGDASKFVVLDPGWTFKVSDGHIISRWRVCMTHSPRR